MFVNLFPELKGAPAIVGVAILFDVDDTDSGALHRTLYGRAARSKSATDLASIWSVYLEDKSGSLFYL